MFSLRHCLSRNFCKFLPQVLPLPFLKEPFSHPTPKQPSLTPHCVWTQLPTASLFPIPSDMWFSQVALSSRSVWSLYLLSLGLSHTVVTQELGESAISFVLPLLNRTALQKDLSWHWLLQATRTVSAVKPLCLHMPKHENEGQIQH